MAEDSGALAMLEAAVSFLGRLGFARVESVESAPVGLPIDDMTGLPIGTLPPSLPQ